MAERLAQRVKLPIAAGDPYRFEPTTITVADDETVTAAKLEIYRFREEEPFLEVPASNLQGPMNSGDGTRDYTCRVSLTGAQTAAIGTALRRFKLRPTINGVETTVAAGYLWCEA